MTGPEPPAPATHATVIIVLPDGRPPTVADADAIILAAAQLKDTLLAAPSWTCVGCGKRFPGERTWTDLCAGCIAPAVHAPIGRETHLVTGEPICPRCGDITEDSDVCTVCGYRSGTSTGENGAPPAAAYDLPPAPHNDLEPYCTVDECGQPVNTERAHHGLLTHAGGDPGHDVELGWRPRVTCGPGVCTCGAHVDSVGHVTGAQT